MQLERILVVDDEEVIRDVVCAMLSPVYACESAGSGAEALDLLKKQTFSLVLSDLMMAGMHGLVLLEQIRKLYPETPVIVVTAVAELSVALNALRQGAYDYVLKPFEREQLLSAVRRALEHSRLLRENRAYQDDLEALVAARTDQLRQAMERLERSYDITLEALGDALDLKDAETEGHSKRVTAFTIAIARAMELPAAEIRMIARGAFLHDIGKMAIPDSILRKPGQLTADEAELMREHCYRGYQMLRKIPFLQHAAEIVYAHQEKWDGTGYPRGLKGDEIPIGARIFSVADTLDAITSDRPYRKAKPIEMAQREIQHWSGRQFDPEVVRVFLTIPVRLWSDLRRQIDQGLDGGAAE